MLSLRFISDRRLLSKNMRKLNWKNERRGKATLLDCVTLILFCRAVWLSFFSVIFFSGIWLKINSELCCYDSHVSLDKFSGNYDNWVINIFIALQCTTYCLLFHRVF